MLTPAGAKKPPGKFNTATFWHPREAKMRKKQVLEGVLKKQQMLMRIRSEKSKVFDGSEARLALYSSLISHFRHFQKKHDEKRSPK